MIKKIIILTLIIGFIEGCSTDLLDITPKNQLIESNYYQTEADLQSALIAAYDPISWVYCGAGSFHYGASNFVNLNVASDDANAGGTPGGQDILAYQGADKFNLIPSTQNIESIWLKNYTGIYRCNILLEKASVNDATAEIRAEAKFLRAYYYFDLVRFYGDVVLLDHPVTPSEYNLTRTPASKIYDFIVKDLTEAIPDLTEKNKLSASELFRATKSAAQTLLGKVYLFMSSTANNYGNYYQNAADLFGNVIQSGIYSLQSDYDMNFDAKHEHGIESIFELEYTNTGNSTFGCDANGYSTDEAPVDAKLCGIRTWTQGSDRSVVNLIGGWGFVKPTRELVDAYISEHDTVRLNYNIYLADPLTPEINSMFKFNLRQYGTWLNTDEEASADYEGFFRRKYRYDVSFVPVSDISILNTVIMRYSDVLLMMAECIVNGATDTKNGNSAAYYVNKVRTRVKLPSISTVSMDDIKKERRLEFAFEMIRYWDLLRWGDADNVFTNYKPGKGYYWDPAKKGLWPIPLTEINRTGGSLTQNPGYVNQ
jgi:starch-binding outer membrane protein, SusD/RagB family